MESETTSNFASAPWNLTLVTPVKFTPRITTVNPTGAWRGTKLRMVGATMKALSLVPEPWSVVTWIGPVRAPGGTVATITESEGTVNPASAGLNRTDHAPVKCAPRIVTVVPGPPPGGVKPRNSGNGPGARCQ